MKWAGIPGFEELYEVSDMGQVRNSRGMILRGFVTEAGHIRVDLYRGSARTRAYVHRLVAAQFVAGAGPVVRHLDGNPANNIAENLAFGTQSDNGLDAVRHGTWSNGRSEKTVCVNGHPLDATNTVVSFWRGRKRRNCAICRKAASARGSQKRRAPANG